MALLEEPSITQPQEAAPKSAQPTQADSPVKEAITKVTEEPTKMEKPLNWFPGWKEVLHTSRTVVATGQIPCLSRDPKQRPRIQSSRERMA